MKTGRWPATHRLSIFLPVSPTTESMRGTWTWEDRAHEAATSSPFSTVPTSKGGGIDEQKDIAVALES